MALLKVDRISKFYDHYRAVDQVSFHIEPGRMFGLLGTNGAVKNTSMRMFMKIIILDEGRIEIFGSQFREEHKNRIGYLPEERGLYPKMKVIDHLQFLGEMKGLTAHRARQGALKWLERFELESWAHKKVQELSKGMQQKVQFIGTILHDPDLIIMDEPFAGLDPINTKLLKDILLELKQSGKTIILSTHLMDQAEKLCEEICLINQGAVVLQGSLAEIKQRYSHNAVQLEYNGDARFIASLPMVERVNDYGNYMEIRLHDQAAPRDLFRAIARSGLEVTRFEAMETSLNDIFIEMVGGGNGDE